MITQGWAFAVYGDPRPKGSMKCIAKPGQPHRLVPDGTVKKWQDLIEEAARAHVGESAAKWQPVRVRATFSYARPAGHYRSTGGRRVLRADAPLVPSHRGYGDPDKLLRAVLDALERAGVVRDDAQVFDPLSRRRWTAPSSDEDQLPSPGVVVRVRPLLIDGQVVGEGCVVDQPGGGIAPAPVVIPKWTGRGVPAGRVDPPSAGPVPMVTPIVREGLLPAWVSDLYGSLEHVPYDGRQAR